MHNWSIFGAQMNHKQTQTHMTHHDPDLGEANTFPLIIFFVPVHRASTQMLFCPKIPKIETPSTLEAHNLFCRHPIKMRFEGKF